MQIFIIINLNIIEVKSRSDFHVVEAVLSRKETSHGDNILDEVEFPKI